MLFHPLHTYVCESCFLVQLDEYESPENIFSDYPYFSSYSESWVRHAEEYTEKMISRFKLNSQSTVVEIASNDGYLLQHFLKRSIPSWGIEPAQNVAEAARAKGISVITKFFSNNLAKQLVEEGIRPNLLLGNNVLAHVPDLNDFVEGLKTLLREDGVITMEFPHLLQLLRYNQFDTIYHEHFSYFSLLTVRNIFAAHGLHVFDVDELATHGGSLRIYACHKNNSLSENSKIIEIENIEIKEGLQQLSTYIGFTNRVRQLKNNVIKFFAEQFDMGKTIAGYGAAAKGNTLLNYCGIDKTMLPYVVDRNPVKQGLLLPGTSIPIFGPSYIENTKPDYILILPWNLKEEVSEQLRGIRSWGGKFVTFIPDVEVF